VTPREVGAAAGELCLDKAERAAFDSAGASRFILGQITRHGATSGEDLVDAAKLHGFRPTDDRAFGPIFAALVRKNLIRSLGYCERVKGNGTAGCRLWGRVL